MKANLKVGRLSRVLRPFSTRANQFHSKFIREFQVIIGHSNVFFHNEETEKYRKDWTNAFSCDETIVCRPGSTTELSSLMSFCHENFIGVVPQGLLTMNLSSLPIQIFLGGNTGLSGGSVPSKTTPSHLVGQIIVSLERFNQIDEIDPISSTLICGSGCILENLANEVNKHDLILPLDLGAKGSCMIGGNVSTNAGGLKLLKYGSMFANVLGVEVVLADGSILNSIHTLRKDNTGYHLRNLFIGSEGTLGIITKVSLQLHPKPKASNLLLLKIPSFSHISECIRIARREIGDSLSAMEFIDVPSLCVLNQLSPHLLNNVLSPLQLSLHSLTSSSSSSSSSTHTFSSLTSTSSSSSSSLFQEEIKVEVGGEEGEVGIEGEIMMLIECSGSSSDQNIEKLSSFLESIQNSSSLSSLSTSSSSSSFSSTSTSSSVDSSTSLFPSIVSLDSEQEKLFWSIRESIPVVLMQKSRKYPTLVSFPPHSSSSPSTSSSSPPPFTSPPSSLPSYSPGKLFKFDLSLSLIDMDLLVSYVKHTLLMNGFQISPSSTSSSSSSSNSSHLHHKFNDHHPPHPPHQSHSHPHLHHQLSKSIFFNYEFSICCFGHVGDNNLHLNLLFTRISMDQTNEKKEENKKKKEKGVEGKGKENRIEEIREEIREEIKEGEEKEIDQIPMLSSKDIDILYEFLNQIIFEKVIKLRGSISAEHGIGQLKREWMERTKSPEELQIMKGMKLLLDPHHILNPNKVLP